MNTFMQTEGKHPTTSCSWEQAQTQKTKVSQVVEIPDTALRTLKQKYTLLKFLGRQVVFGEVK